jgi:aminoglycoside phosphotransferase (APT) family kinase protein
MSADVERLLGSDLAAAVRALDLSVVEAVPLMGRGYPGYRPSAYRLRAADERVVKGRIFSTARQAELAQFVARCLGPEVVPAPLERIGVGLVTEWVEGHTAESTAQILARCGRMQSLVNTLPLPDSARNMRQSGVERRLAGAEENAAELIAAGVLTSSEGEAALAVARAHMPGAFAVGFALGDLCPENTIVRTSGDVCFVDHDTLAVTACEFDLARTWHRWRMTAEEREVFYSAYAERRSLEPLLTGLPYWAVLVLLSAGWFRLSRSVAATHEPIRRLRRLVSDVERGLTPRDIAYM